MQIKKEEVRKKIIKAATKEFKNNGYKNATMRKISNSSGIPIGNLYRYYQNKEALYNSIVSGVYEQLKTLFIIGLNREIGETANERNHYFFNELIDVYSDNYDETYILLHRNVGTKFEDVQQELGNYFQQRIASNITEINPNVTEEELEFIRFACRLYLIGIGELIQNHNNDIEKLKKTGKKFITFYMDQIIERMDMAIELVS